jgi:cyclophilin family peptidyl-prolyl cis-trans isomerase
MLFDMKPIFFLLLVAAALALAACVLETPTPISSPTAAPTQTLSADPTATQIPAQTLTTGSTPASDGTPVKRFVETRGVSISQYSNVPPVTIDVTAQYTATIRTNLGTMVIDLFADQAPIAVNNFIFLANDGYYDGQIFHRVIPSFMIQGGDPTGTGFEGPGYRFQDETDTGLTFDQPGKLAMANSGPGTNGSQFFVTTAPTPHLNGRHTIFGQVAEGQDVADAISLVQTGAQNRPSTPVVIQGIDIAKSP